MILQITSKCSKPISGTFGTLAIGETKNFTLEPGQIYSMAQELSDLEAKGLLSYSLSVLSTQSRASPIAPGSSIDGPLSFVNISSGTDAISVPSNVGVAFNSNRMYWDSTKSLLSTPPLYINDNLTARVYNGQSGLGMYIRANTSDAIGHGIIFTNINTMTNPATKMLELLNGGTEVLSVTKDGKLNIAATDSSSTPGATTINKAAGKSAIAAAATSVVITNAAATASSLVIITPTNIDANVTKWSVTSAAGSFTVTVNTATAAAWSFNWLVIN